MNKLLIVESPAKARTIERYLGGDYSVMASYGHVRDLPKGKMGVDVKDDYKPEYVIPVQSKKTISALKNAVKAAELTLLATDPDREGEAIAWHVAKAVGLGNSDKYGRVTFHSITKETVTEAVQKPRKIDMDLVDAQQARRVIDRLVGYSLSPILWKKVYKGLSAGRVQSVAVRLVVEREREIEAFKPEEYWLIEVELKKGESVSFLAKLVGVDGKKIDKLGIKNESEAKEVDSGLKGAKYTVDSVETRETKRTPPPPFTTSTLQQAASGLMGWSAKQTMRTAQALYEAGQITYMRTDSVSVNPKAIESARKYIAKEFGDKYLPDGGRQYKTKQKRAQEAHEAIRPTNPQKPADGVSAGDPRAKKLYDLIWRRMIASQMADARYLQTNAQILAKVKQQYQFQANGIKVLFAGWRKIYRAGDDDKDRLLPELKKGDDLDFIKFNKTQKFTEPPPRYTEATLIKALEERGIGRPSTYAPTMSTIMDRGYVIKDRNQLQPEKIGMAVNDLLVKHFSEVVDYDFTAKIEDELDGVAAGEIKWHKVVDEIYKPLTKQISEQEDKIEKVDHTEKTDEKCPECKKPLEIKRSRFGKFYGCTGFPDCKYTRPFLTEKEQALKNVADKVASSKKCPKCGGELVARKGRYGWFVGCKKYPECKYLENVRAKPAVESKK